MTFIIASKIFSPLGMWDFTTMFINNNVLQFHGTLLSENLSVYLVQSSSCLLGDVNLWCFLFCFLLLKYKRCINSNYHFLSSIAFVWQIKGGFHLAIAPEGKVLVSMQKHFTDFLQVKITPLLFYIYLIFFTLEMKPSNYELHMYTFYKIREW